MSNSTSNGLRRSTRAERDAAVESSGRFGNRPPLTKYFEATPCEGPGCENIVPAGMYPLRRTRSFCSDTCRARNYMGAFIGRRGATAESVGAAVKFSGRFGEGQPRTKYFEAAPCEGPGCTNIVPAGVYSVQLKRRFCSRTCRKREKALGWVIGMCMCGCGQPVLGEKKEAGKRKFVDEQHYLWFMGERGLEETGCFRPLIERYIKEAQSWYSPKSLVAAEGSLVKLFRFAVENGISDINEIRSSFITGLINAEESRGVVHRNYLTLISTFFNVMIEEELYQHPNPVIPRRHYRKGRDHAPRPYSDTQFAAVRTFVEAGREYELMLAFWIGAECGLRVGEVCNIRLPDVDLNAQTIHVRLPTKNGRERDVSFHDQVKKYLSLWLEHRSRHCPTDHLLHNGADRPFNSSSLGLKFQTLLRKHDEPAKSFKFHRLRHTWATRLLNNGMELAVLMELGGWKSLAGVACYIRILPATIRRQYEAAYKQMQEQQDSLEDEGLSLLDFAAMATQKPVTSLKPAA